MTHTPATPAGVTRTDGVKAVTNGRGKYAVQREGEVMGTIWDEGAEMARGRYAAWSPFGAGRNGSLGFFHSPAEAVDAVVNAWPPILADIANEAGASLADATAAADALADDWEGSGQRVYRTAIRGAQAKLTAEAAAAIRETLTAPAAPTVPEQPAAPQWRTLKGIDTPFHLYGQEGVHGFRVAGDRKQCTGQPLLITRIWMDGGMRYGEDASGRQVYLGGAATRYWVAPAPVPAPVPATAAPRLMPDQAHAAAAELWPDADDFHPLHGDGDRFLGYTFRATNAVGATRYGWITSTGACTHTLDPHRDGAGQVLVAAVMQDERPARQSPATLRTQAQRARFDAAAGRYRAEMDDRTAAEARRYGGRLSRGTADRIAQRMAEHGSGPFKSGDLIVCPDGITRIVHAMAPAVSGEPAHVIVDGGAQWIADNCHHAEELIFHGPQDYTGSRALCGYADHTAPADLSGNLAVHERTPGVMVHCPGSLKTPRARRDELTRRHTTAYSYSPPRPDAVASAAKPGDVVVWDGHARTVQDVSPGGVGQVLVAFTDATTAPITVGDRITYQCRVRSHEVPCQGCGVTATTESDDARYGIPTHRLCGVCDHPDATDSGHRTAVLQEAAARITARAAYSMAHGFQPVLSADGQSTTIGWTFRTGGNAAAAYQWVTALGRLASGAGTGHRWQSADMVHQHHRSGTLAPTGTDLVAVLAARPLAEVRIGLDALREGEEAAGADPARRVVEGVIVEHDGTATGSAPRHAAHPDVAAARRALDGLRAATVSDHHDINDPADGEREAHGYVIDPRTQGRVAVYWLEGGRAVRHDERPSGTALDCLADRFQREGWETEKMLRSSLCLFAHVPQDGQQG